MSERPDWESLLASLRTWAEVREVAGGVEVTFAGATRARRTVEIVMDPQDWEELSFVIGVESEDSIRQRVLALEEHERFLVCDSGVELVASPVRELPSDELADFVPDPGGQWVVTDDAGNIVDRFTDPGEFDDPPSP